MLILGDNPGAAALWAERLFHRLMNSIHVSDQPHGETHPSLLTALRSFEAAARHHGFRGAAEELGITQSAISHQVAALEEALKVTLFRRVSRGIEPTRRARSFIRICANGFDRIAQGASLVSRAELGGDLDGAGLCDGRGALAGAAHPSLPGAASGILVRFHTRDFHWEFDPAFADIGMISTTKPDNPDLAYTHLFDAKLIPVCTPGIAQAGMGLRQPADLVNHALLQVYTARRGLACLARRGGHSAVEGPRGREIRFLSAGDRSRDRRPGRGARPAFPGGARHQGRPLGCSPSHRCGTAGALVSHLLRGTRRGAAHPPVPGMGHRSGRGGSGDRSEGARRGAIERRGTPPPRRVVAISIGRLSKFRPTKSGSTTMTIGVGGKTAEQALAGLEQHDGGLASRSARSEVSRADRAKAQALMRGRGIAAVYLNAESSLLYFTRHALACQRAR